MFDLHNHILPAIDDGAPDWDTALAMVQTAVETGTTAIVATPHVIEGGWLPDWEDITARCCELAAAAQDSGLDITIYPGAEVALAMEILERVGGPGSYCINGGKYMLVELPATHIPAFADEFFFTLQARGITPIIAHPERHPEIARDPEILKAWIEKGILAQLNGPSLTGRMGQRVMATAELLLTNNMVHCIGSDAHGSRTRSPRLTPAVAKITALAGTARASRLLYENPKQIINGEDIEAPAVEAITYPKKSGFFKNLLSRFW